jgi:glycosyltransferase 2 family protein
VTRLLGSRVLRLALAVALTAYLFWRNDPYAILRAITRADLSWVLFACALVLIDRALMAWRWLALLRPIVATGMPRLGAVMRVFFISTFLGTFLPSSVGGDVVRAYGLSRHDVPGTTALASVAMDRALGVISVLLLGFASVLSLTAPTPPGVYALLGVGGAASLALATIIFADPVGDRVSGIAARLPGGRIRTTAGRLVESIRLYRHHHGALAGVLTASLGVQILRVIQAWGLGRALGIDAPLALYFVAIPIVTLIMQIPVTVSGLGTGQAAFLWTFGPAGVPDPDALALSVLFIALGIVGNLPGGFLYVVGARHEA